MKKTYKELSRLKTIEERFEYLKMSARVGEETFGFDRYLNQIFYNSPEWRKTRRGVIIRDEGCDLGVKGYEIPRIIIVHHINPITEQDILDRNPIVFDPENLICASERTHKGIHFGDKNLLPQEYVERREGDTCPWKRVF